MSGSRPLIGLGAGIERARSGPWDSVATMLPRSYALAVQAAGAVALLLPPDATVAESPDDLLDTLDGLILAGGGADVGPDRYGAAAHPNTDARSPERDEFELALARRALERDLPLLGVCRGMQVLNVALGGTLAQHLPDTVGDTRHNHTPGQFADHEVQLEPGSLAARVAGGERVAVKSHHHQGVDLLGDGLRATGWSIGDDVLEAVELPDRRFALGLLWHPEEDPESSVVGSFVAEVGSVRA